jgi:hypothetical protein
MIYHTDMEYNTTENYTRDLRPKLYKRLRNFIWINPIHETVRIEPLVFNSDIEILHKPTSNHSKRDLTIFDKIIKRDGVLDYKLHTMYSREVYKCRSDDDLIKSKEYFERIIRKQIMTNEDYDRAKESIAVLAKIYNCENDNRGLLTLLRYTIGDLNYEDTKKIVYERYESDMKLSEGILDVEHIIREQNNIYMHLLAELTLQIGIRLLHEDELEESRKWLLRTIHKTRSAVDVESTMEIPNKYLEIIDKKKERMTV